MRVDRKALTVKFKHIYIPVLALAARLLAVYSFLNWLLVFKTGLIPAAENVVDYWLPIGLSAILVLMFIHRNLGLLKSDPTFNLSSLCHVGAIAFLAVPTIVAQGYLRAAHRRCHARQGCQRNRLRSTSQVLFLGQPLRGCHCQEHSERPATSHGLCG
jgi:hypothetical protein